MLSANTPKKFQMKGDMYSEGVHPLPPSLPPKKKDVKKKSFLKRYEIIYIYIHIYISLVNLVMFYNYK